MTLVLDLGSGIPCCSPQERELHRATLSAIAEMGAWVDPDLSNVTRDIVQIEGRSVIFEATPQGGVRQLDGGEASAILHRVERYAPVSFSAAVAEELCLCTQYGLPSAPDLARGRPPVVAEGGAWKLHLPGMPLHHAFVCSNHELRDSLTVGLDASWIAEVALTSEDVRALDVAVHDFFEVAYRYLLVTRVG